MQRGSFLLCTGEIEHGATMLLEELTSEDLGENVTSTFAAKREHLFGEFSFVTRY